MNETIMALALTIADQQTTIQRLRQQNRQLVEMLSAQSKQASAPPQQDVAPPTDRVEDPPKVEQVAPPKLAEVPHVAEDLVES